jgi:tol-pal system protein YbgF
VSFAPGSTRRLARRVALSLTLGLVAAGSTACATKADVRDIRTDLNRMEARQDSIYTLLYTQNRQILDSLTVTTEELLNVRGELATQLSRLQDQLVQVSDLTGQVQVRLNQLDQELAGALRQAGGDGGAGTTDRADPRPGQGQAGPPGGQTGGQAGAGTFSMAQEIYEAGLEQVNRGNAATARRAFEMVVDSFPDQPMTPEAQRQIGETLVMDGQYDQALRAFDRVVERYPDSDAAPRALYRAGVIAQERGQADRAREYYRRVISAYPASDARRLAETALERMR